jgi:hypothetical protein
MQTPTVKLQAIGGPLDGDEVTVETFAEVVHWWGHVYRVSRDDDGSHVLVYIGVEHPAAA